MDQEAIKPLLTKAHWSNTIPQNPVRQQQRDRLSTVDHGHFIGVRLLHDTSSITWGTLCVSSMNGGHWYSWPSWFTALPAHADFWCHCIIIIYQTACSWPNTIFIGKGNPVRSSCLPKLWSQPQTVASGLVNFWNGLRKLWIQKVHEPWSNGSVWIYGGVFVVVFVFCSCK